MKLKAVKKHAYRGRDLAIGDHYEATDRDGAILIATKRAERARFEPVPAPAPAPAPEPPVPVRSPRYEDREMLPSWRDDDASPPTTRRARRNRRDETSE